MLKENPPAQNELSWKVSSKYAVKCDYSFDITKNAHIYRIVKGKLSVLFRGMFETEEFGPYCERVIEPALKLIENAINN